MATKDNIWDNLSPKQTKYFKALEEDKFRLLQENAKTQVEYSTLLVNYSNQSIEIQQLQNQLAKAKAEANKPKNSSQTQTDPKILVTAETNTPQITTTDLTQTTNSDSDESKMDTEDGFTETTSKRKRNRRRQSSAPKTSKSPNVVEATASQPQSVTPPAQKPAVDFSSQQPSKQPNLATSEPNTENTVPTIVLRDKTQYEVVISYLKNHNISFGSPRAEKLGIRLFPSSKNDLKSIIDHFSSNQIPYHTYRSLEDRNLHVIIKGVLESIPTDSIKQNLTQQGYQIITVNRWRDNAKNPINIVQVILPKNEKSYEIFKLKSLISMAIQVEAQKPSNRMIQCRNCQVIGHSSQNCTAPPRCLKCAQGHHTSYCTKSRDTPATCANCAGPHPANYRGCPAKQHKHTKTVQQQPTIKYDETNFPQLGKNRAQQVPPTWVPKPAAIQQAAPQNSIEQLLLTFLQYYKTQQHNLPYTQTNPTYY